MPLRNKKILIVDDTIENLDILERILKKDFPNIIRAKSGIEAIDICLIEFPDIILCDIVMPGITGYDVIKILKANPLLDKIPFLFLTSKSDPLEIREGMRYGADDYLIKPFNKEEILNAVRYRLEKIQNLSQFYQQKGSLTKDELQLEQDMIESMSSNGIGFSVEYQPKYASETLEVVGAEALVRWNHPNKGKISPVFFIPIAEKTELLNKIGNFVLDQILKDLRKWAIENKKLVPIAMNISAKQFSSEGYIAEQIAKIENASLPYHIIELELTESSFMNFDANPMELIEKIRSKEIKIAMDDFGAGYSSLTTLKHFPFDILKIDREFIKDIHIEKTNFVLTKAIIEICKSLGIKVVAEGVEKQEELNILRNLNCDFIQGFFLSKPISGLEFEKLISQ